MKEIMNPFLLPAVAWRFTQNFYTLEFFTFSITEVVFIPLSWKPLQKKMISKITIKEICDLSEMSRSTFYLHYPDQFALLEDIEKEVLEKTFEYLKSLDTEANSIASIEVLLKYIKDNKATFGILFCQRESSDFQKSIIQKVQTYLQPTLPGFPDPFKEKYIYSFIMHGSHNIIVDWINNGFDMEPRKLADIIYHICNTIVA